MQKSTVFIICCIVAATFCSVDPHDRPEEPFLFTVGDSPHGIPDCTGDKPCGIYKQKKRHPILYAGGLGGSSLLIKKENVDNSHWRLCYRTSDDFYEIWLNIGALLPIFGQPCWLNDFSPIFDKQSCRLMSKKGVTIMPKDFGGISGIKYLATGIFETLAVYVAPMMDYFINEAGYIPGKDLRAITVRSTRFTLTT